MPLLCHMYYTKHTLGVSTKARLPARRSLPREGKCRTVNAVTIVIGGHHILLWLIPVAPIRRKKK